jgi:MFS family permease
MQYVYIQEETPAHLRTQAFTSAKIVGLLAILSATIIRLFIVTEESENWRPVFYFPIALGTLLIILSFAFLKESRAFLILKEDRKLHPEKYVKEKLNFKQAFRDFRAMPTWNQFKYILIIGTLWAIAAGFNGNNEATMDQVGMLQEHRSIIFIISTIFVGISYFMNGQIADKIGRKPAMIMNSLLVAALIPLEYFAIVNHESWGMLSVSIGGMAQGLRIGAFWSSGDVRGITMLENTPTRLRGFAQMLSGLLAFPIIFLLLFLNYFLLDVFQYVMQIALVIAVPVNIIVAILVAALIKETKDVDITKIEG